MTERDSATRRIIRWKSSATEKCKFGNARTSVSQHFRSVVSACDRAGYGLCGHQPPVGCEHLLAADYANQWHFPSSAQNAIDTNVRLLTAHASTHDDSSSEIVRRFVSSHDSTIAHKIRASVNQQLDGTTIVHKIRACWYSCKATNLVAIWNWCS